MEGHVLFLHVIIGSVLYPWVNCTGIRTLNPGFRGSPLTHGYKRGGGGGGNEQRGGGSVGLRNVLGLWGGWFSFLFFFFFS